MVVATWKVHYGMEYVGQFSSLVCLSPSERERDMTPRTSLGLSSE